MAGIYSQGGSAGHRYAGWLSEVEAKNFQFGGKVFNGSPSAIYVGSNLVWWYWLKPATKQAIIGAFGQRDGMAVIKATNAYLNQLAASGQAGKDKATALAGFINEDPMMVCNIGITPQLTTLPSMPWRLFNNGGTGFLNTGIILTSYPYHIEAMIKYNALGGERDYCGNDGGSRRYPIEMGVQSGTSFGLWNNGSYGRWWTPTTITTGMILELEAGYEENNRYLVLSKDGGQSTSYSQEGGNNISGGANVALYAGGTNNYCISNMGAAYFRINANGGADQREYYPIKRNGVLAWIDLLHNQLYTNAGSGSFTEEFGYMQNGQWVTWTPSTP